MEWFRRFVHEGLMLCIHCEEETQSDEVCDHCGEAPLVAQRYRVLAKLGQGATGTTYRAERVADGREVALKELLVRYADSLKTLELFEREANTLRLLEHRDIPAYHEDFTVEQPPNVGMYIAQDYVAGEPLSVTRDRGPTPLPGVLSVVRSVAAVLRYLHGLSPPVVHRDIKPENLLRRPGGRIAVIDFGSVQDVLGDGKQGVPTMAGTIGYMAPEQLRGTATPASDVFALGTTAITLLTGRPPTDASSGDWSLGLPVGARALLKSMIAVRPENRPTAAEIATRVDELLSEQDAASRREDERNQALQRYSAPRAIPANFVWGGSSGKGPPWWAGSWAGPRAWVAYYSAARG